LEAAWAMGCAPLRGGSSRSDDDAQQLRATRNRTLCRRDACRRRVGEPFRRPRKDGAGDRFRCTLARGTGADLLRWSRNTNFSVTGKDLHRIRQYLLLIHIQRGIGLEGQDG